MNFQVKILLVSFVFTVVFSNLLIPLFRKFKIGQIQRDDGPESHFKKRGTPTMGGIILMVSITIACAASFFYYMNKEPDVARNIFPILIVTLGFGVIGFIDDFKKLILKDTKGLKPIYKVIGILVISVGYVLYLIKISDIGLETYIPFVKTYIELPIWFYVPFATFVMLAATNAINLTDGVDGLASSITALIITFLTIISITLDIKEVVVFGSVVTGSCLGFLLFNLHPAKVFMGDTGSLALGGAISAMALYIKMPLILLIVAGVSIIETISVIIQVLHFKRTGRRVFKMAPIHHHFELSRMERE